MRANKPPQRALSARLLRLQIAVATTDAVGLLHGRPSSGVCIGILACRGLVWCNMSSFTPESHHPRNLVLMLAVNLVGCERLVSESLGYRD
ncbi:hypothetical protein Tco_1093652 [Tanacetum coccineum]|uniref:Secreted protein n=1 Tax=Tanacetum coccineum TaxID=301880 RepID=A0ABQ5IEL5_9ASTR